MFTDEYKNKIRRSLEEDPIPVSEVVFETAEEVRYIMMFLEADGMKYDPHDRDLLHDSLEEYKKLHINDINSAISKMEIIYSLAEKYYALNKKRELGEK